MKQAILIRAAVPDDAVLIFGFIRHLAENERLSHEVDATQESISAALFGRRDPKVFCEIAEMGGRPIGFALWFYTFSTFRGRHGLYLEDLYVSHEARGKGAGKRLLAHLARRCVREGLLRLEWSVLDWNEPAIGFYQAQGAELQSDWTMCRLSGTALCRLAEEAG
jgi:GNAT superfamily N-acetyltransferase